MRRRWRIRGQVQGVGFRPFLYRLAGDLGLSGTVRNEPSGVELDAWGRAADLDALERRIAAEAPPLAQVDRIEMVWEGAPPANGHASFHIVESRESHEGDDRGRVTVDSATCSDCLDELFSPDDRRFRHALINCTNCGPRYSIVRDLPYDRPATTMADFAMCADCAREYSEPGDRRFHAQPTCCTGCGPQVRLTDAGGGEIPGDPFTRAAEFLREGRIVAMKGIGGYHLAVDARRADAVRELRSRKKRDHKPFALMAGDLAAVERLVELSDTGREAFTSPLAPIVLAARRARAANASARDELAAEVAPGSHRLGLMLPYTPMQHLLFREGLGPLVMTSANLSDEPLVAEDADARSRLSGVCDAFLWHDRPIERAVDDSIVVDASWGILPLRRARGYVPLPVELPVAAGVAGLCTGSDLKNTVAVVKGDAAVLSQHIGDIDYPLAHERFEVTIRDLERLFEIEPRWIACDLHPAYLSRRYAARLSSRRGIDLIAVQHHHAHVAALLAEHGRVGPIVGVVCDGVGHGSDGTAWGGEILLADLSESRRLGHLRALRLPGGDAAAKQTGRCAASWLFDLLGASAETHPAAAAVLADAGERRAIFGLLRHGLNCPPSTGLGRLFDAAASLLGLCDFNHFEVMSGLALEAAAAEPAERPSGDGLLTVRDGRPFEIDHRPLLARLISLGEHGAPVSSRAWLFHDALAAALSGAAIRAARESDLDVVGLTGGVFCNVLLTQLVARRLRETGLEVLLHRKVPPNDGGLALGQAAVAACRFHDGESPGER